MKKWTIIWIVAVSILLLGCKETDNEDIPKLPPVQDSTTDATTDTVIDATTDIDSDTTTDIDTESGIDTTSDTSADVEPVVTYKVNGFVQKGPFVTGSSITIQELDSNLEPNGKSYQTTTNDDFGSFALGSQIGTNYIEIIANGYYFNEVSGKLSASTLTLRAISDLSLQEQANVNILTTLEKERLKYLINQGSTFIDARTEVEQDILKAFGVNGLLGATFDSMDISQVGPKNEVLLAISAILQSDNSIAEMSELISKINLDLKEDGTINDSTLKAEIKSNSKNLDLASVRVNIESRYSNLGFPITVGSFDGWVDSDGDDVLNKDDDDEPNTINFISVIDAELATFYESNEIEITGLAIDSFTGLKINKGQLKKNSLDITGDITIKNLDKLKFTVTSSQYYDTTTDSAITINGKEYKYTVKTKADDRASIIIFNSGIMVDGSFLNGNPNYHNDLCSIQKTVQGIPGDNSAGFIGLPGQEIKNIITQDTNNPRKVKSKNGSVIKENWWLMHFQRVLEMSFADANILGIEEYWWSGSKNMGELSLDNCNGWTSNNISDHGSTGLSTDTNLWVFEIADTCNKQKYLLCVAY